MFLLKTFTTWDFLVILKPLHGLSLSCVFFWWYIKKSSVIATRWLHILLLVSKLSAWSFVYLLWSVSGFYHAWFFPKCILCFSLSSWMLCCLVRKSSLMVKLKISEVKLLEFKSWVQHLLLKPWFNSTFDKYLLSAYSVTCIVLDTKIRAVSGIYKDPNS